MRFVKKHGISFSIIQGVDKNMVTLSILYISSNILINIRLIVLGLRRCEKHICSIFYWKFLCWKQLCYVWQVIKRKNASVHLVSHSIENQSENLSLVYKCYLLHFHYFLRNTWIFTVICAFNRLLILINKITLFHFLIEIFKSLLNISKAL